MTRAIELLKALATSYHPHPELVEQAKAFVVELFPDFKPAEAEVASGREPRDTALRADASPQGGSGGGSPTADPNINKNEPTPAEMPRRAIADTEIVWVTNPAGAERVFCTEDGARHDLATNYPDKTGIMVHKQAGENFDLGGQVYSTRFTRAKRVKGEAVANVKMVIEEIKEQQNARKELRATTDADLADRIVVWLRSYSARDDGTPILIQSYLRGHGVWATLAKIKEIIRLNEPKRRGRKPGWRKQVAAAVE